MTPQLVGRRPTLTPSALVDDLVPPPHFVDAAFDTYLPDPDYPSQAAARERMREFATRSVRRGIPGLRPSSGGTGLYLDGGFGVGKTHLLAAAAHAIGDRAAFGTFVEYTHLVGALGFAAARAELSRFALVCIDEFELDDPGDTLLMARLMRELTDAGVAIAATSNTLPDSLGEGRFAAEDFKREIQSVARLFTVATVDGPDYRHRGDLASPAPARAEDVESVREEPAGVIEDWWELVADLWHVHPSRYGAYVAGIEVLGLREVAPLRDQAQALRLVALVDRLYDRDVRIVASGAPLDQVFPADMLRGGYRKKYFRAVSRLTAMAARD